MFKVGDLVRLNDTEYQYILDKPIGGTPRDTRWQLRFLDGRPGGCASEHDLELIQEDPDVAAFNAEQEYRESIQEDPMSTLQPGDSLISTLGGRATYLRRDNTPGRHRVLNLGLGGEQSWLEGNFTKEDPMPEHPSLPLTPENIERVGLAICEELDHTAALGIATKKGLRSAVKSVLEREAKPKPKVFTVTMEGSVTRDGVIAALITSSRYEENRLITVEEVTP